MLYEVITDIRGKDVMQQSFVGVAFHGVNNETLDAVYFRPFNFRSDDPVRKVHAVQYISHPNYPWHRITSYNVCYTKLLRSSQQYFTLF